MEEIRRQVIRARRRLVLQQFLKIAPWVFFVAFLIAAAGLAVPKLRPIGFLDNAESMRIWTWSWIGGAAGLALLVSSLWTWLVRRNALDAAIELDRRFGLKERISSSLALRADDRESAVGRALLEDAARRVAQIRVAEQFRIAPRWHAVAPLLPAAVIGLLFMVENATSSQKQSQANEARKDGETKVVKKSTDELRKKLEEQKQKLDEKGLEEAKELFAKMQKALDKQLGEKERMDRKEALVKLNDLSKELERRREELGGTDKLKQQMQQMKNFEKGPADRMADSFRKGDFKNAIKEAKQLQEKLAKGELTPEQQKQLAKQMQQMENKLNQLKAAHEQAKQELREQIKKKEDEGDLAEASKLQRQLDKLEKMDQQMDQLEKLAQKCQQASQASEKGQQTQAAEKMAQMVADLEELEKQLEELEAIEQMMDQLADAKDTMACDKCDGDGCAQCQGKGASRKNGQPGRGLGDGRGQGDRPEERTDTGTYDSRVVGKPRAGESVKAGFADGANIAGKSKREIQEQVIANSKSEADALPNQPLPKAQRDYVKQYFESYQNREKSQ
ncbi:MAG: hypothetical protein FJ295_03885 [Planctomycetes bacterium]|nr:hypothetical protein [Planctomycetota bacterium]